MDYLSVMKFLNTNFIFVNISDIVDILVVSYLIYKVMIWIKETRVWTLFKGIVVLLIIFFISSLFNFNTVYWLVSKTFNIGLIAVIVLFQPELRKALAQLGKNNFFQMVKLNSLGKPYDFEQKISEQTIDEIIKAAKTMAAAHTGALIVIEREIPLGDFEQTGITIDAVVSNQLLINIFEDKTPLHDGAVIIRDNKIKAAACILPLSQNITKHDFGTRHRAAIGVSEVSDAYVLVVSEERGEVSIAKNGKLHKNIDDKHIRNILSTINDDAVNRHIKLSKFAKAKIWRNKNDVKSDE